MKNSTTTRWARVAATACGVAMLVALGGFVADAGAQDPSPEQQAETMRQQMAEMRAERQQMMQDMQAMDDQLNELVARMNAADGDDKVDAMAEVVTALVERHGQMRMGMMTMQGRMMEQMGAMQGMMGRGTMGGMRGRAGQD